VASHGVDHLVGDGADRQQDGLTQHWSVTFQRRGFLVQRLDTSHKQTRSHPEMVGDMSRVTLNFDLSKIPFVHF